MTVTSRFHDSVTRNALRSYLAEFISTFFFVILVVGSGMASREYPLHLFLINLHFLALSFMDLFFFYNMKLMYKPTEKFEIRK